MFLHEPDSSAFDLRFRLFGIGVRVHPWFWLGSAFLGWNLADPAKQGSYGLALLLIWIAATFVSILLHEMGHVLMGLLFGSRGHIVLHGFGGLAIGSNDLRKRWQRIAVSLAGPAIQLVLCGLIIGFLCVRYWEPEYASFLREPIYLAWIAPFPEWVQYTLFMLLYINLYWPLFNLLPIWPLDGGMVSRELFTWGSPGLGVRYSLILSIAAAGLVAVNSFMAYKGQPLSPYLPEGGMMLAMFCAFLAFANFQELQQTPSQPRWREPRAPWEQDADYWKR